MKQEYVPRIQEYVPRIQEYVPRIQDYVPRIQEYVPRIQEYVPRIQEYVPRIQEYVPRIQSYGLYGPKNTNLSWCLQFLTLNYKVTIPHVISPNLVNQIELDLKLTSHGYYHLERVTGCCTDVLTRGRTTTCCVREGEGRWSEKRRKERNEGEGRRGMKKGGGKLVNRERRGREGREGGVVGRMVERRRRRHNERRGRGKRRSQGEEGEGQEVSRGGRHNGRSGEGQEDVSRGGER